MAAKAFVLRYESLTLIVNPLIPDEYELCLLAAFIDDVGSISTAAFVRVKILGSDTTADIKKKITDAVIADGATFAQVTLTNVDVRLLDFSVGI